MDTNPCSKHGDVLLIGEGDFSFAVALLEQQHLRQCRVVATGLDSSEGVVEKYCDASANLRKLRKIRDTVSCHHNVDATKLDEYETLGKFEHVIFTHPHLGTEDCRAHYSLLAHFFAVCRSRLVETGAVHVTLAAEQSENWHVVDAAKRHGWNLVRETPFLDRAFPGYTRRRSHRGASFRVRTPTISKTFTFATHTTASVAASPPWNSTSQGEEISHVCEICGRRCFDERGLEKHVKAAHHSNNRAEKKFACDVCEEFFHDAASLRSHRFAKHNADAEKLLKPDWWQQQQQQQHRERKGGVDADGADEECAICGCSVVSLDGYRHHISLVPQEASERLPHLRCTVCDRRFRDLRALSQHTLSSHPKPS